MTSTDRQSPRGLLLHVLVALLLLLAWGTFEALRSLAAGREVGRPVPVPVPPDRSCYHNQRKGVKTMTIFGVDGTPRRWEIYHDLEAFGTAFAYPSSEPIRSYRTVYFEDLPWPGLIPEYELLPALESPGAAYATHVVLSAGVPQSFHAALLGQTIDMTRVRSAIYTEAGELVVGSAFQDAVDGEGWVEFPLGNAPALVPGTSYTLWVSIAWHVIETEVFGLGFGIDRPVSLESTIEVADLLRTGVTLNSGIGVEDTLRPGVALNSGIAVSEKLSARNQPTDSGYCYGHEITEEDAGGTIE